MSIFSTSALVFAAALSPVNSSGDAPTSEATLEGPSTTPAPVSSIALDDSQPWRLQTALGLPDWLKLHGFQRTRWESLGKQIRAGQSGGIHGLFLRTLLEASVQHEGFRVTGEIIDSRAYSINETEPLNTGIINAAELLQGYVAWTNADVVEEGDTLDLQFGRHTMDVGSRRFVARNRYRNTINQFTGLNAKWDGNDGSSVRAFAVRPVRRLPTDQPGLQDNDTEFDDELEETHFFGLHGSMPIHEGNGAAEAYAFYLDEDDQGTINTRDRQLWTIGARVAKKAAKEEFHYEWESAYQFGDSRATSGAADTTDLDHSAQFHHLIVGYQFDAKMKPQLEGLFDYASGDSDPTDGDNNRFDTLFGARRFEYGPTGVFGPFARSNILTPGLRLKLTPHQGTKVMLATRLHYLASDRDAWTTSGLVDPAGNSGRFIGQFAEVRVRHDIVPKSLQLEVGFARLFAGGFIDNAPNATTQGNTNYAYGALTFTF